MTTTVLSVHLQQAMENFTLDVKFNVPAGLTVLFGTSGSGKTSVIDAVAGLRRSASGRIVVGDQVLMDSAQNLHLPAHKRQLGYIFQDARLFPHMSVARNLDYARWVTGQAKNQLAFDRVVEMLGIGPLLPRRPARLSGGETQRVAIGRALLARPKLILADEPLAALDDARKGEILPYFERLRDESDVPILYVTHAATEVARLATTVVALEAGTVVRQGTAAEVLGDPSFRPGGVRDIGAVIEARVTAHHPDDLTELEAGGLPFLLPYVDRAVGEKLRLRIAAQDVILSNSRPKGMSALNILPGTIADIQASDGPGAVISLDTAAGRVLARVTKRSVKAMDLHPGVTVFAVAKSVAVAPGDVGGASR
ncbi:molybdenum ABC transporter ATP-binding protein [Aliiroseovarius sp. F47248L]|uniref:molybdenum ABC transporter ATP-binding protein n=1 Tax=Aliiroseovarius sp. F47248L TaxID=2926420 RepID=UPI001FF4BA17|nr:molybdenum ABC transporter ATP-binding protein [Aliiroseovarius sp. F47248L]MCK0137987.1 molybdenum ABC transporter ATP-binding protein [Aliiroseovarius sp. F47248L]